jgi:hypothetical protein
MVGNDASNKIDILGLLLRKYPLCKIAILVGHFSSVDIDIIEKTLRNPANGDISDALFVSLLTCFRKTANDDFDPDRQIPDPDGTRQDNLIFPSSDADMRKHFMYDENRGDETVGAGLRKELRLSEQYSESLCNCCEKIAIYIRGIDDAGIRWTRNNLYGHMSAQTSVETFDCDSKQWTVQNPAIKHFKR